MNNGKYLYCEKKFKEKIGREREKKKLSHFHLIS